MTETNKHLFVFGLGYSATFLARKLLAKGWKVSGTVRHPEEALELKELGITLYAFDGETALDGFDNILQSVTHVMSSVPPKGEEVDIVLKWHFDDLAAATHLDWVGYLSTTGVYGDRDGGWVDEESEQLPTGPRGQKRVDGEAAWFKLWLDHQIPTHTYRLAGIYGPGRNALETVKQGRGRRINKPGQVFSRIHIEDIAQILEASMVKPNGGQAYNACDDNPAPPEEVIAYACDLLGVDKPDLIDFETADLSPMARSFYRDNKRVSNQRIKEELGVKLLWPDYRDALKAML
ncbi:SDR family oxidoreductase [Curvivirga sp.]|uniref:SDR family oxidoreductase n=1 Tax=Curvivirga sp. TaxID=2856848 RepID=UPI003B5A0DE8